MKNKVTIHQFDPVIYPRKLWIVSTKDEKIIKNNFTERDGEEMVFEECIGNEHIASVIPCTQKGSGLYGSLIWIQDNKKFDAGSFCPRKRTRCLANIPRHGYANRIYRRQR